ncbi:hypothetical protein Tco_0869300 [Tanacetum coccineum]
MENIIRREDEDTAAMAANLASVKHPKKEDTAAMAANLGSLPCQDAHNPIFNPTRSGNEVNIDFAKLIWDDILSKLKKKSRGKVILYPKFLSLLLDHKIEGYGTNKVNFTPTQIFSIHNWTLKKNQPEGPSFIYHMLAICNVDEPMKFKAPKTSSKTKKKDPKGKKPIAKSGHRKQLPVSKNHPQSNIEVTNSVSLSKEATTSQAGHSKKRKKSGTAKDTNPSQPQSSTHVVTGMHKEVQQATSGPTSLGVTDEEGADPQLSNMKSASHSEPIFSASTIVDSKSVLGHDASAVTTTKLILANLLLRIYYLNNKVMIKDPKTIHLIILLQVANNDQEFNTYPELTIFDDANEEIKLEDMSKLVKDVGIETVTPPKHDTQRNNTFGVLLHNTSTRVPVNA